MTVEWNGIEGEGQIDVFTAQGQPVETRTLGSQTRTTFSTHHWAQGMYTSSPPNPFGHADVEGVEAAK